jgi:hypothetical protein
LTQNNLIMTDKDILFTNIKNLVQKNTESLKKTVEIVKNENVSNYPIITISSADEIYDIGIFLNIVEDGYFFFMSTLEELFAKNIVSSENVNNFRQIYNHKTGHFCVLSLGKNQIEFLFIPINL